MTKPVQLDAEIAEALTARARRRSYWDKRFVRAEQLAVGDVILAGSVPPYTAHEVVRIEPAPRRRLSLHLVRLPDRDRAWTLNLRPSDSVGVP
jgi:hypothetical protein